MECVAYLWEARGNYEFARSWHTHVLKIREHVFGADHPSTIRTRDALLRLQKTAQQWFEEGCGLMNQERYEEALISLEQAIQLDPQLALAHNNKGMALWSLNRHEEALISLEQAIQLDPQLALVHNNKGLVLESLNRHEEALISLEQAIQLDPQLALAYNNKGTALWGLNRYEEALAAFEQAILLVPDFTLPRINKQALESYLFRYKVLEILNMTDASAEMQEKALSGVLDSARRRFELAIQDMLTKKQIRQLDAMLAAGKGEADIAQWMLEQFPFYDEMMRAIIQYVAEQQADFVRAVTTNQKFSDKALDFSSDWIIKRFRPRKWRRTIF